MQTSLSHVTPPKAPEVELRVISALTHLGDPTHIDVQKAMLSLDVYCFNCLDYRQMYEIIRSLFDQGKEFSFVTFITLVPDNLYEIVYSMVKDDYINMTYLHSDIQQLLFYRNWRNQLKILVNAINSSLAALTPDESLSCISDALQGLSNTSSIGNKSYKRTSEQILDDIFTNGNIVGQDFLVDIPGLPPVPNESMITIAGRSGHGKTFFGLYLMDKIIEKFPEKQAIYFNLEMRDHVLLERLAILNGFKQSDQMATLKSAASNLISKNLTLVTKSQLTIEEIETESRLSAMQNPINVIVVDYLGLIRSKTKHESNHLLQSDIAKRLASLATDLKCVVICLIQVNRDIKHRPISERCPIPTDSAESMGGVDSTSWWIGINQPQNDSSDSEWQDMFQLECRKSRTEHGTFSLKFKFKNGRFFKWERPFCNKPLSPDGF